MNRTAIDIVAVDVVALIVPGFCVFEMPEIIFEIDWKRFFQGSIPILKIWSFQ